MDLRRLEYFLAVVTHGQVTAAANALHVAQPSLSQAIRSLERDLGTSLFVRDGRGLTPTAAGEALVEPARRVLHDLAAARSAVSGVVELAAGGLDLVAGDLLAVDPLGSALAAFRQRHTGVPVRLREPRDEDELVRLLVDGEGELAVAYRPAEQLVPLDHPALRGRWLGTHEAWVIAPPGTELPHQVPLATLHERRLVDGLGGAEAARASVRQALAAAQVRPRIVVRTRHREAVLPLVLAGVGWAITTSAYALRASRAGAATGPVDPAVTCGFAVLHRRSGLSPAAREFLALLSPTVPEEPLI